MENSNNITSKYFGVYYSTDGKMMIFPGKDQKECLDKLADILQDKRYYELCQATTVIKRDMSNFKDGLIFGCPKSLNLKLNKNIQTKLNIGGK